MERELGQEKKKEGLDQGKKKEEQEKKREGVDGREGGLGSVFLQGFEKPYF